MNQYPPGLGYGPQEVPYRAVGRRRPSHSAPFESPRRHAVHSPKPMHPPFTPQSSYNKFDPFADENSLELVRTMPSPSPQTHPSFQRRKSPPPPAPSAVAPRSAPSNHWPPSTSSSADDAGIVNVAASPSPPGHRDARAKLVAGILLNRVHAVGRPMRRRYFAGEPREYVRSRLSSVVTADV